MAKVMPINGSPHAQGCTYTALSENMAWLIKCIEAGRAAGVPEPTYERRIATNFID